MSIDLPHDCETMVACIRDDEVPIVYNDVVREFALRVRDGDLAVVQVIQFCPWCGQKLPDSLREEWFALATARGYELGDPLPSGLSDGAWWRNSATK